MSTFGDNTPEQELYEWVQMVMREHHLSPIQIIKVLLKILNYLVENLD